MVLGRRVDVDAVHVDEARGVVVAQHVHAVREALLEDVVVPVRRALLAAEDELDGAVDELEGLGPLVRLLGVVLLRQLLDLPGAPALVAEGPVLDLEGVSLGCVGR